MRRGVELEGQGMNKGRWGLLAVLAGFPVLALAVDVGLAGVMSNKVLLSFDGGSPVPVPVGQTVQGVRLVSAQGDQAVIEVDGKKRTLRVGQNASTTVGPSAEKSSSDGKVTLMADGAGHFYTTGSINGVSVRFLVDTGATFVSIGASDARRIGIDTSRGQQGMSNTANGVTQVTKIKLDKVQVGEVTLLNVDGVVHSNELPIALLGMSFLNRMEMQREGSTMTLKKRF